MSGSATVRLEAGDRILTARGMALVVGIERHAVRLRDVLGEEISVEYRLLYGVQPVVDGAARVAHAALRPWWDGLTKDAQQDALFKQEVVLEILTGYREGYAELANPGEPFYPFGPDYGTTEWQRIEAMAKQASFEKGVDRGLLRRLNQGEIVSVSISTTSIYEWVRAWRREGLRGLVDKRKTRGRQGFEVLDPRFLRVADEVFAEFDGGVSAVNLAEVERRIRVRLKAEGVTDVHLPVRLTNEYLSSRYRALGRTTRAQRSRKLRGTSGTSSFAALRPGQLAMDMTRADNLVFDEVHERVFSVEIITVIDVPTRVIVACRVVPRSANGIEAGLAIYDAMRPFAMLVDGTTLDDWRWTGIPESLDMSTVPTHVGRQPVVKRTPGLAGRHHIPAVTPRAVRCDHGSVFVGGHFRGLMNNFGVDLMLSRGKRPTDNSHVERWHETLQRAYQSIPGFKGRNVQERGRYVGTVGTEGLLTARELELHLRRFIALDYHRTHHQGLVLPGAPEARLTPLELFDALLDATGRIHVPQHPDLLYQFLPLRWLTVRHAGVEYKNLAYDARVLDDFRTVRAGRFRAQDAKVPFHYDPHDVTRLWFRHPHTGRIDEVPWRGAHLIDAPLTGVVRDHVIKRINERGGNKALTSRSGRDDILAELGELTSAESLAEFRAQMSAARLRFDRSRIDHGEAAEAQALVDGRHLTVVPDEPAPPFLSAEGPADFDTPWPDLDAAAGTA